MKLSRVVAAVVVSALASPVAAQDLALDASDPVRYYVAPADSGGAHPDAEYARWAFEAWSAASKGALKFVETDVWTEAVIRVYWVGAGISKYGEVRRIEVGGQRGAEVYINTSTKGLGEDIHRRAGRDQLFRDAIVFLTCVHEIGHAVGLSHSDRFADIMYSFQYGGDIERYFQRYRKRLQSRGDMRTLSPLSDNDVARLRALY